MKHLLQYSAVIIALITLTLGKASAAQSIQELSPESIAQEHTDWMMTTLDLDESMRDRIYDINLGFATSTKDVAESEKSRFTRMRELKKLAKAREDEFRIILTESQYEDYKEAMKVRRKEQKESFKAMRAQ
jgi:hypothetical protein